MGWNTWNTFACKIEEKLIHETAERIVDLGLKDLGYTYLNLDDCWQQVNRTEDGHVQAAETFPSGMKSLADFIHSKGLLFGLYSSAGTHTCAGRAGGMDFEDKDAESYASWGVDYLKYDNCFNEKRPAIERYSAMRDALNKTGRPIFYSICNWGQEDTASWGPSMGNSWRTTMDIKDFFLSMFHNFIMNRLSQK
jgi:alpha-galactosidase